MCLRKQVTLEEGTNLTKRKVTNFTLLTEGNYRDNKGWSGYPHNECGTRNH
jgi:hypothetical protein